MSRRVLYLIRHGHYRLEGTAAGSLSERGIEQARTTAYALRRIPFTTLYISSAPRALQTAELIADPFPTAARVIDDQLRECIPQVNDTLTQSFQQRYPDLDTAQMQQCELAMRQAFRRYFVPPPPDDRVDASGDIYEALVCHGNIIRFFVSQVLQPGSRFWMQMLIHHCGVSRVAVSQSGTMLLISHNDIGHLSDDLRTEY